jgi:pimeloyl-ACP methyl ester carboxylesterase
VDQPGYAYEICTVPAPSLAGNLVGQEQTLNVDVLVPHDSAPEGARRPVVYLLAGYEDTGSSITANLLKLPVAASGSVSPIFVIANGINLVGGSFYVNSSVTGRWEDAIVSDLVGFMDSHFATIAKRESRGLGGHSMGGFGALNIAMRHPEVFGAVYAISPGAFDPQGAPQRLGGRDVIARVLQMQQEMAKLAPAERLAYLKENAFGEDLSFEWAYGLAFAPDPTSPWLMRYPFSMQGGNVVRDDALWATWEAGFGGLPAKVAQYAANLKQLSGIGIEYGTADEYRWIPPGCAYLVGLLRDAGLTVDAQVHGGDHGTFLRDRLVNHMVPFMAEHLSAEA